MPRWLSRAEEAAEEDAIRAEIIMDETMAEPRPCMPESKPALRHLLTGTPCSGCGCEECRLQWLLTGNIYLTLPG